MDNACFAFSYTWTYLYFTSLTYQCVVLSVSVAVFPFHPCLHPPRSFVSVCWAHMRWREPLLLGWSQHSCATELRKTGGVASTQVGCLKYRTIKCTFNSLLFEEYFHHGGVTWWGYIFHPGIFSRDRHTVESLSLCSHSVSGVKIHLEVNASVMLMAKLKLN